MKLIKKNSQLVESNNFLLPFLLELRLRLFYCVVLFLSIFCVLSPFSTNLYQYLAQPLINQLPVESRLISTTLEAPLFIPLKFTIKIVIFIIIPFVFYQLWLFVAPALYFKERRLLRLFLIFSSSLFYSGIFFTYYFILPLLIKFFINISPEYIYIFPDINQYLDFSLQLILGFGLVFELPLLIIAVVVSGLLNLKTLLNGRRYFIVFAFVIAMFLTPPDVVSQFLLALPLCLLFELTLLICRLIPERNYVKSLQK